ncbi:MAG: NAD(P)H-dependent oxidoreductase [Methanobrevibacter sp.]|jgi:multimeric flavodoxin WrbA/putative sterol carrier protein|nr:NAD(P)H-dependent oxidoreductase [Methanobrevibacter sp.]
MKILVLNGSPRGNKSNTFQLTENFIKGLNNTQNNNIDILDMSKQNISPCLGCFNCWTVSPGKCVIKDDMEENLKKYINADLIIWSFPLYYFGMPSQIKVFMDRLLPLNLPFIEETKNGGNIHPPRYDLSKQNYVLISTCGFYTKENNYDALFKQFELVYGDKVKKIICTEGELFAHPSLKNRTSQYLSYVKTAGEEYGKNKEFSKETEEKLDELLYDKDTFIELANLSWDINTSEENTINSINNDENNSKIANSYENKEESYRFMKQMAAIYNKGTVEEGEVIIEIYFTDLEKTYQIHLSKNSSKLKVKGFKEYNTRIETSFQLWKDISEGKVNGAKAMIDKKYRVLGDFNTMLKMDDYFGVGKSVEKSVEKETQSKSTNMLFLLAPWIIFWVLVPINSQIGGTLAIISSSLIPLLRGKFKLTIYDLATVSLVSILGVITLMNFDVGTIVSISYLLFGVLWLFSGFLKIPLTAYYSNKDYNGELAFKNPLFIKTNRILTIEWGVLYVLISISTIFIMQTVFSPYVGLINSLAPLIMGIYTNWFSKWYPAHIAKAK